MNTYVILQLVKKQGKYTILNARDLTMS